MKASNQSNQSKVHTAISISNTRSYKKFSNSQNLKKSQVSRNHMKQIKKMKPISRNDPKSKASRLRTAPYSDRI